MRPVLSPLWLKVQNDRAGASRTFELHTTFRKLTRSLHSPGASIGLYQLPGASIARIYYRSLSLSLFLSLSLAPAI